MRNAIVFRSKIRGPSSVSGHAVRPMTNGKYISLDYTGIKHLFYLHAAICEP